MLKLPKSFTLEERLWSYTEFIPFHPCWQWIGPTNNSGYGTLGFNKKNDGAHRWSYQFYKGPIPKGMVIDHICRNRGCINPEHLRCVTPSTNINENAVGNAPEVHRAKKFCPKGHEYIGLNLYINKTSGARVCRKCTKSFKEYRRLYMRAKRAKEKVKTHDST